jgi:hypothetical protein
MASLIHCRTKTLQISWPLESKRRLNSYEWEPESLSSSRTSHSNERSSGTSQEEAETHSLGWDDLSVNFQSQRRGTFSSDGDDARKVYCSVSADIDPDVACDDVPSDDALRAIAELPILDEKGNSRPFKSLYSGSQALGEQQLIIFVRHFFCGVRSLGRLPYCSWSIFANTEKTII